MTDKKLLFICSRNKLRSPTAEALFSGRPGVSVDSAGLSPDAEVPLEIGQLEWADLILVMEKVHRTRLNQKFNQYLAGKKIVVLDIPDDYTYMDARLVSLLEARCARHFP